MKEFSNTIIGDWQTWRRLQSHYPGQQTMEGLQYALLALCGEAGEAANVLKKVIRDERSSLSQERKVELLLELGDVLWYIDAAAEELGADLNDVVLLNTRKIEDRKKYGRGVG